MNRFSVSFLNSWVFVAAWAMVLSHHSSAVAQGVPIDRVVVLRNGNVLRGEVIRIGDHYRVKIHRGELRIPVSQVEMFCRDLNEAYERRRAARTGFNADSHLDLAAWCLRHELLECASRELLDARAIDPGHGRLLRLERRLQYALTVTSKKRSLPLVPSQHKPTKRTVHRHRQKTTTAAQRDLRQASDPFDPEIFNREHRP